jgi:Ca2+-transporting ATPase
MALAAAALFALGHDRALPAGEVEALAAAKTAAVTGLVVVQACWLAAARGPRLLLGRGALAGAAALVALQAALVHLPPLQAVFATAPLDAASWLAALAAGAAAVPVAALADRTARRAPGGRAVPPVAAGSRREEVRT